MIRYPWARQWVPPARRAFILHACLRNAAMLRRVFLLFGACFLTVTAFAVEPRSSQTADLEFFEKKVRPILAANCYSCHGPEKQKAGLRLDSRDLMMTGGDSGPVIVPGN